jgi:hypothetical protein
LDIGFWNRYLGICSFDFHDLERRENGESYQEDQSNGKREFVHDSLLCVLAYEVFHPTATSKRENSETTNAKKGQNRLKHHTTINYY